MALLEAVENGQVRVTELRGEVDRARDALDRTDALLAVADDSLARAEVAIVTGRRWAPVVVVLGVVVVGAAAFVVLRRMRRRREEN